MDLNCSYEMIQTPIEVWEYILNIFPIQSDRIFFEPFKGDGNLYNLINCEKEWCELMQGKDIFDYDFKNSNVTTLWTNPPFKSIITNKNNIRSTIAKNCVFYFLEKFMTELPKLNEIGFLINAKSFQSLTPKRLTKLNKLGFYIHNVVSLNIQKWYGLYYFVRFVKEPNNSFIPIWKYF